MRTASAWAADPPDPNNAALAQALFAEGRVLLAEDRVEEACAKFEESQRVLAASGTLLNLGLCHEKLGKLTRAYTELGESLSRAVAENRPERESLAREHLAAIEGRVARVTVSVGPEAAKIDGLEVKLDGVVLGKAAWGVRAPVDVGSHVIEATAPRRVPYRSTIDVASEGESVRLDLPVLALDPNVEQSPAPPAPPKKDLRFRNRVILGTVIGGIGFVSMYVGIGVGLEAKSQWDEAKRRCPNLTCRTAADRERGKDAGFLADVGTTVFINGAGATIAGALVIVYAFAKRPTASSTTGGRGSVVPLVGNGVAGLAYGARF